MTSRACRGGIALLIPLLLAATAYGQGDDAKKKQAEMMAAYAKAAAPGPQHKMLEPMIGQWTFTGKFWMDPSQPPMEAKGTSERKWILGGRFVADEAESASFAGEGFKGFGVMGYDNVQQKYTSVWVDSMSTMISHSAGTADSSGKVFTYHKEEIDPLTKQKIKGRDVVKFESKDKHSMEMYKTLPDGKEMKVGELIFTRKK